MEQLNNIWGNLEEYFNGYIELVCSNGYILDYSHTGSIHSSSGLRFISEFSHADQWVLDTISHGLVVELTKEPEPFAERNNSSAELDAEVLRAQVEEWEHVGFVCRLPEKPVFLNPISIIKQTTTSTKETKFRPVINMSRVMNQLVICEKTKLDDLSVVETIILKEDFLTSFDLENMHFHVRLQPESVKYFGFSVPDSSGCGIYYRFLVMCYGYRRAVEVVTRLTKSLNLK